MSKKKKNTFVTFNQVSKKYRDVQALDNVSFEIEEGEIFGYIGPNGAGKTTTIKIMVGLITEFTGNYTMQNFSLPRNLDKAQKLTGYLPQGVAFQEWRTVDHALHTFGKLSGVPENQRDNRITELLELLHISNVRERKINKLSGGMIQKVGLVQALLHSPRFLVLDEPLSGLDPESRHMVKKIIKDLCTNGTTVFFSSHILSDVQNIADRMGIINNGRILKIGTLDDLKKDFYVTNDIEIHLSYNPDKTGELSSLEGIVRAVETDSGTIKVQVEKGADMEKTSDLLLKKLIELGFRIKSFNPVLPDLDDVYLKYIEGDNRQ